MIALPTESTAYDEKILQCIVNFLEDIGIKVIDQKLDGLCILLGLSITANAILLDKERLKHPGDLLHEAGHLAVTPKDQRALIGSANMDLNWPSAGDEIAAILWSYAAICYLKIAPDVVFHTEGYKNESKWLIEQFENGNYIGLPLLEWMGLCHSGNNIKETIPVFPNMIKWLR
jgi:hypothetical protein